MKCKRIDFVSADAARFNTLREQWRRVASGSTLPKVAHRLVSLLPSYVNREYGYAFPTDERLAGILKCSTRQIGKGLVALDKSGLIQRDTKMKRDHKREAAGRVRRIYLTLPTRREGSASEVKGTPANGTPSANGTKGVSERNTVFRINPDKPTLDKKLRREKKVSAYVPAREDVPSPFRYDTTFLDTFDMMVMKKTDGKPIGAGEIDLILRQAFDQATDSSCLFMPFHWSDVCALRSNEAEIWFRRRAGQLIHRRAA